MTAAAFQPLADGEPLPEITFVPTDDEADLLGSILGTDHVAAFLPQTFARDVEMVRGKRVLVVQPVGDVLERVLAMRPAEVLVFDYLPLGCTTLAELVGVGLVGEFDAAAREALLIRWAEVVQLARLVDLGQSWEPGGTQVPSAAKSATAKWPVPLGPAAKIGLVGEFLRLVEPETEADPAALVMSLLTFTGNAVGRAPYFLADGARHGGNLFSVIVGETSRGRKGTSEAHARNLFTIAEPTWTKRVIGGLSSGEGLIYHVRDATERQDKAGKVTKDPGRLDHRLMVRETEFGKVLQAGSRQGCTLLQVLRQAWDGDILGTLTRAEPMTATDAHVSLLAHVTVRELTALLDDANIFGGFGNRCLWICARRQRELPFGGNVDKNALHGLAKRLEKALEKARHQARLFGMTPAATDAWPAIYSSLTRAVPGVLGAVTSRSEAQVRRLALIYAILDFAEAVDLPHLLAAVEVMRYGFESARWIFGEATGDSVTDKIAAELRDAFPEWMARDTIRGWFGGHIGSDRITAALEMLRQAGKAECKAEATGGRPKELWQWSGS
jgi:hypothetical protein